MPPKRYEHILLPTRPERSRFKSTRSYPIDKIIPTRNRNSHSQYLKERLSQAWQQARVEQAAVSHTGRQGVYIEFKSDPGADLVTKSLEDMTSKKVRLLNVRTEQSNIPAIDSNENKTVTTTYATVYIANDKREHFFKKIQEYAQKEIKKGRPQHADLINSIADIRKALQIDSFWQDDRSLIPDDSAYWCEVWLSDDSQEIIDRFEKLLTELDISFKNGVIKFPERSVKVIQANRHDLEQLLKMSDDIAEYRRAKPTARFWTQLRNKEQAEWSKDLLDRLNLDNIERISVCILDTGVNNGHPLISPVLQEGDCLAVDEQWGTFDHDKHGTLMAGVVAYGDLNRALSSATPFFLRHHLESVKILPLPPNQTEPDLWGFITSQGISVAEIHAPEKQRIFCLAVTSADSMDQGRPSSWSAQLDQIASGANDDFKRLIVVSAGNSDPAEWNKYPAAQQERSIHDPAQSWNAITVGAYTELDDIQESMLKGYRPLAPRFGLSPFSTTSFSWPDSLWPVKPEIVLEGGNLAIDDNDFVTECDDLSLLSTFYNPQIAHFHSFNMTSAATANAANMAAKIQAQYPEFWPETIRALMIHSAEWPEPLYRQFVEKESKSEISKLLRICGYGVPSLERALYSAENALTLISQSEIQPYDKPVKDGKKGAPGTNEMHLFELPWPVEVLRSLPDSTIVTMRVTLSYFIEPGPGEVGWRDRYRYASHALRFDLISPTEIKEQFVKRINRAARAEDEGHPGTPSASSHWTIGQARDKGSIHSDIWTGTSAELAASNIIAVSPRIGWWRERAYLGRWGRKSRYSLVVSITTPDESVDIYTPVAAKIGITSPVIIEN